MRGGGPSIEQLQEAEALFGEGFEDMLGAPRQCSLPLLPADDCVFCFPVQKCLASRVIKLAHQLNC